MGSLIVYIVFFMIHEIMKKGIEILYTPLNIVIRTKCG